MATVKTTVTPHIKNEIKAKANKAGITDAEYVRQAIEDKLRRPEKKVACIFEKLPAPPSRQ